MAASRRMWAQAPCRSRSSATPERLRPRPSDREGREPWAAWGPYLGRIAKWGTIREYYSPHGGCWNFFLFPLRPRPHARALPPGCEDGLSPGCLGLTKQRLGLGSPLWTARERLPEGTPPSGLNNGAGNQRQNVPRSSTTSFDAHPPTQLT